MEAAHELLDALGGCRRVLLTGPVQPDGDSLGACLALQRVLEGHHVDCHVTGVASHRYRRLPGVSDLIPDHRLEGYDAVVVLDGDRHRLPPGAEAAFQRARVRGIIDHHASTRPDGYTHFWVAPTIGSTCEMLYEAFRLRDEIIDHEVAHCLYAGLIFDTGAFRYSNTRPESHAMAAELLQLGIDHSAICLDVLMDRREAGLRLAGQVFSSVHSHLGGKLMVGCVTLADLHDQHATTGDVEGIVENLVHVTGTEVGVLIIERQPNQVKLSLRSRGHVDVALLANQLHRTGGGHKKAAGVVLAMSCDEAEDTLVETLQTIL